MKVCVTGSAGFIMGYVAEELLRAGHQVIGVDNFSKYGEITRSYLEDIEYVDERLRQCQIAARNRKAGRP